jgi:hypothetical protein
MSPAAPKHGTLVLVDRPNGARMLSPTHSIGGIMKTPEFFEHLSRNPATETLAVQLAELLAFRGRPDLVPVQRHVAGWRRMAS